MPHEISGGFAFYGYIPDGSNQQHLGIVLGLNEPLLKYCYCTSKYKVITGNMDFIKLSVEKMRPYFTSAKETYIYLSERHIQNIYIITFESRINNSEYEEKGSVDNEIYISILTMIENSDNLSERFKRDFFEFLNGKE